MNIVYITEYSFPHLGGAETFFYHLAEGEAALGHQVTVLTSLSGSKTKHCQINKVNYHYFSWFEAFNHILPKQEDIEKFIAKADIVHTATYTAAPLVSNLAKKYRKPCVITPYEVLREKWFMTVSPLRAILFYLYEQYVIHQKFAFYHAISQATKKDLLKSGIVQEKIRVIYCGAGSEFLIKNDSNHIQPSKIKTFIYYGRQGKTKGIQVFQKAIEILQKQQIEGLNFKILYNLPLSKLLLEIKQAYCVVIPSLTEGFGFTTVESCTLGKPVIISNAGSLPEVAWGKVLVFKNRSPQDLAANIILAAQGKFQTISKKDFSWKKTAKEMEELYKEILNEL